MRAREFITEDIGLQAAVADALPATYVIPKLQNQDPYLQYRFGVALAAAKGRVHGVSQPGEGLPHEMEPKSEWGENMVIVSYDPKIGEWIDAALHEVGLSSSDKKLISTTDSIEPKDTSVNSPIKPFRGYKR